MENKQNKFNTADSNVAEVVACVVCVTIGQDGSSNLSSEAVGWTSAYSNSNRHLWKYLSLEMVEWVFRFLINSTKTAHI